jgi:hypothetical protein
MAKYHTIACHVLWREFCYYASLSRNTHDFHFLEQGLHNTPDILRTRLQEAVDAVTGDCDAILIGYGLCSNGVEGIRARDKRLVIIRAHDCITFLLGSKERYREYFDAHPGTYWYSPGWIDDSIMPGKDRQDKMRRQYIETYGEENAQYLMEAEQGWYSKYSNAAYVDLGFYPAEQHKQYTRDCAKWLNWDCDMLAGDPRLMVDLLEGNWNSEDFLVVEPGEIIGASHEADILCARKGGV